ncbi:MAG: amidophosphoribosyltransferase [Mycoplasmatales bacterium]
MRSSLNEECGVFGVVGVDRAAYQINLGLHMLQHRGQDGAGIITVDEKNKYYKYKDFGLVSQIFDEHALNKLQGNNGIGHVRYATSGGNEIENIQPFLFYKSNLSFSLCHNGNIVNSKQVKARLESNGSIFQSNSDSEILAHLIMQNFTGNILQAIKKSLHVLDGAFAFLILYGDTIYACRDKYGIRPLSVGKLGDGYVLSSETAAFSLVGAEFIKDLASGEILEVTKQGITKHMYAQNTQNKICSLEYIYFARPDSNILGKNVHMMRKQTGIELAKEAKIEADIVIGVPDSSLSAALGYAKASKIPYDIGLVKHKYIGRTFIEPTQTLRENAVKMKLSVIKEVVKEQRVVLVDDSIVRGTTSKKIVALLKEAGAKEIHVMIASPMMIGSCYYGIDIQEEDLIASGKTVGEVRDYIQADSLHYLSLTGLKKVIGEDIYHGYFDKNYPTYLYEQEQRGRNEK